jgi:hypothetical protein
MILKVFKPLPGANKSIQKELRDSEAANLAALSKLGKGAELCAKGQLKDKDGSLVILARKHSGQFLTDTAAFKAAKAKGKAACETFVQSPIQKVVALQKTIGQATGFQHGSVTHSFPPYDRRFLTCLAVMSRMTT